MAKNFDLRLREAAYARARAFLDGTPDKVLDLIENLGAFRERLTLAFIEAARDGLRVAGAKGGDVTRAEHGPEYFSAIGRKGGARVRELIARGRARERR